MTTYMGTVCAFAFNFAPVNWALCGGQLLSINEYTALYALLGTAYGGDGQTTFGLPNLQNRAAIHYGQGPGLSNILLAQSGGNDQLTLTQANLPAHTHSVSITVASSNALGTVKSPQNAYPAGTGSQNQIYTNVQPTTTMASPTLNLSPAGNSQPLTIQNPSLAITYCISLFGLFPQRS